MKKSIIISILFFVLAVVVIVYITTITLSSSFINTSKLLDINNVIVLVLMCLLVSICSLFVSKGIVVPLKKIEKNMRNVSNGKIIETKKLKSISKFVELQEITNTFSEMIQVVNKNNFDLNSQQSKTEIILEHMADGVIAFSIKKQVVHMNKSAIDMLGLDYETDDTFERITKKLNIELDFDKVMYLPNYKSIETKVTIGEDVLNIVFVPFFSDRLRPMGAIMMVRNITENVKLDNMRKEFVANVSHELKTPLTSIKGYSETIMNGDLTYQEILRFSKVINQEANRMDRLVADLLQLSRFDYNRVNFKKGMFALDDLAISVCDKMKYTSKQKKHQLECVIVAKPSSVCADKDAIEQVIMNILSNSIKYTPEGGDIKVYVGMINASAYFKVVDNGIGIPEEDLERIFERFYRVDKARTRKMGGTGLGLSIVKEIVDGNNGTIDIRSTVNVGTEIIVTLPTKS